MFRKTHELTVSGCPVGVNGYLDRPAKDGHELVFVNPHKSGAQLPEGDDPMGTVAISRKRIRGFTWKERRRFRATERKFVAERERKVRLKIAA